MKINVGLVLGLLAAGTLVLPVGADAQGRRGGGGFRGGAVHAGGFRAGGPRTAWRGGGGRWAGGTRWAGGVRPGWGGTRWAGQPAWGGGGGGWGARPGWGWGGWGWGPTVAGVATGLALGAAASSSCYQWQPGWNQWVWVC